MKRLSKILIINCKKGFYGSLNRAFGDKYKVISSLNLEDALSLIKKGDSRIVMVSINPGIADLVNMAILKKIYIGIHVIVLSAYKTAKNAVKLFRQGQNDYFDYCSNIRELQKAVRKAAMDIRYRKSMDDMFVSTDMKLLIENEIGRAWDGEVGLQSALRHIRGIDLDIGSMKIAGNG